MIQVHAFCGRMIKFPKPAAVELSAGQRVPAVVFDAVPPLSRPREPHPRADLSLLTRLRDVTGRYVTSPGARAFTCQRFHSHDLSRN